MSAVVHVFFFEGRETCAAGETDAHRSNSCPHRKEARHLAGPVEGRMRQVRDSNT